MTPAASKNDLVWRNKGTVWLSGGRGWALLHHQGQNHLQRRMLSLVSQRSPSDQEGQSGVQRTLRPTCRFCSVSAHTVSLIMPESYLSQHHFIFQWTCILEEKNRTSRRNDFNKLSMYQWSQRHLPSAPVWLQKSGSRGLRRSRAREQTGALPGCGSAPVHLPRRLYPLERRQMERQS